MLNGVKELQRNAPRKQRFVCTFTPTKIPMKPKYLLLFFLLIFTTIAFSQSVKLNASSFDFGKIQQWENQPAQFLFKNTGKSSFFFLPTFAQEDLLMRFEQEEIAPGETGTLLVYYYTQKPGKFKRDFQIYLSTQSKPFSLSIQGEIENLGQNALMQCPEFSQPPMENLTPKTITFSFYDSLTKNPVAQVSGEINHGPKGKTPFQTNQGKFRKDLSLGAHGLSVQANGYHPRNGRIWVTKTGKTEYAIALLPTSQKNSDTTETVLNTEWTSTTNSIQVETPKATPQSIQPQLQQGKRPVKFQAIVVDAKTKLPLKDAKIVLQNEKNRYAFLRTPQNGTVSQTVYAGNYRMQVERDGYSGYEIPQEVSEKAELITIQLMKDEPINTLPLTPETTTPLSSSTIKPLSVKIKVVETLTRWPVEMAKITVEGEGYALKILETNKKGSSVTEMLPETYQWKVEKVGYESSYKTKTIGPGNDTVLFELTKIVPESTPVTTTQPKPIQKQLPVVSKKDTGVLSTEKFVPNNIVFLLDVSSSMGSNHKLPVMKKAMHRLFDVLRDVDNISVIVYSTSVGVLVPPTPANLKDSILKHIDSLGCSGRTYGQQALETAYRYAESKYIQGGNNQIILATDGIFNNPDLSEEQIYQMVAQKAESGIPLSVVAFGTDREAVAFLRRLAKKGGGNFWNIKSNEASVDYLIKEVKKNSKKK